MPEPTSAVVEAGCRGLTVLTALATLALWLVGLAGRELHIDRNLQANTERRRNVLSVPFIGRQLFLRRETSVIPILKRMFARLRALVAELSLA